MQFGLTTFNINFSNLEHLSKEFELATSKTGHAAIVILTVAFFVGSAANEAAYVASHF